MLESTAPNPNDENLGFCFFVKLRVIWQLLKNKKEISSTLCLAHNKMQLKKVKKWYNKKMKILN